MSKLAKKLASQYTARMRQYLESGEEEALQAAYELGRMAIANGLGILEMARIHEETLLKLMSRSALSAENTQMLKSARAFFFEALSPFEATQRGFQEANTRLQQLIGALEERNRELARMNEELEIEISERKRTERALRDSEESLRDLSHKSLHLQEEERKRISRELHDEVGQSLTAVNVDLAMLKRDGASVSEEFVRRITAAQAQVESTMVCVHRFARELRPAMLDDLGLIPALRSYAKSFSERTGLQVSFASTPVAERLSDDGKTVVFRVMQESLTNVAKHAQASKVDLSLDVRDGGIRLTVKDNGKSFQVEQKLSGKGKRRLGLVGMQERVRLVGGALQIESRPKQGTTVKVHIPLGQKV